MWAGQENVLHYRSLQSCTVGVVHVLWQRSLHFFSAHICMLQATQRTRHTTPRTTHRTLSCWLHYTVHAVECATRTPDTWAMAKYAVLFEADLGRGGGLSSARVSFSASAQDIYLSPSEWLLTARVVQKCHCGTSSMRKNKNKAKCLFAMHDGGLLFFWRGGGEIERRGTSSGCMS